VQGAALDETFARAELQLLRVGLRDRLEQFGLTVRAQMAGTPWVGMLRKLPQAEQALDKLLGDCRYALRLWAQIEVEPGPGGSVGPLFLGPNVDYSRADFLAQMQAVQAAATGVEDADFAAGVARARREPVLKTARELLMSYVRVIKARFLPDTAPLTTLPRLWALPSHTPDPVVLTAGWDSPEKQARLTWTASEDKTLDHYQIRACPGPKYAGEDERVVTRVPKDAPRELLTLDLLPKPGAVASYRVYVVLTTGNERASEAVTVDRPEG